MPLTTLWQRVQCASHAIEPTSGAARVGLSTSPYSGDARVRCEIGTLAKHPALRQGVSSAFV